MPRIDSHVHAFPDRLALAVRAALEAAGPLEGSPLLPAVAERVREAGFDGAWILPYAHRDGVAASVNEWSAAEVPRYPWLVPGATFHPADEALPALVHRALVELGLRVVKLHCSVGSFSPKDPRLAPLWETASETRAPIVIHAGQKGFGDTAADELEDLPPVLEAYPRLRIVLAHSGHPATRRTLELMERFPNLHADLTPVWDRPVDLDAAGLERFPGRFLFGSDAPNSPLAPATLEDRLTTLGVSHETRASIMGGAASEMVP